MVRKALVVILWKSEPLARESQVLLLRVTKERGDFWQSVTGGVEEGESYEEGALREAQEETGLRFSRQPQYLGLEYEFPSRWGGMATERAFFLPLFGGEKPPSPILDPKEHVEFRWVDPANALLLLKHPMNKEAVKRACIGNSPLFLHRSGSFFQDGEEITHARTSELLHRSLVQERDRFLVRIGIEQLDVVVDDTPQFVRSYEASTGTITLFTGEKEALDPESLTIRTDHSFLCRTQKGWKARFLSSAHYELAKSVEETSEGKYLLHFLGRAYELAIPS